MPVSSAVILEHIHEQSSYGYAPNTSVVESLIQARWVQPDSLLEAFRALEGDEPNRVVLFAQLPMDIRLPSEWIRMPSELGDPHLFPRMVGTVLNDVNGESGFTVSRRKRIADSESFTNARLPFDPYGLLIRTQLLVSFQLWEHRRLYYSKYLDTLRHEKLMKNVLVPPARSWLKSRRAITAEMYEHDLLERLHLEVKHLLPKFLAAYGVAARDFNAVAAPQTFDCAFIMVRGGRIVVRGQGMSPLAAAARPVSARTDVKANAKALKILLSSRQPVSVYERYLLESARQIELGATDLGVVQAVMVLEWFMNEIVKDHLLRRVKRRISDEHLADFVIRRLWGRNVRLPDKIVRYLPAVGLTLAPKLQNELLAVVDLRNRIVHRVQVEAIDDVGARRALETVMISIRVFMGQLSKQGAMKPDAAAAPPLEP